MRRGVVVFVYLDAILIECAYRKYHTMHRIRNGAVFSVKISLHRDAAAKEFAVIR